MWAKKFGIDMDDSQRSGDAMPKVGSLVIHVSDLERSVNFYRDVFSCRIAIYEDDTALLLAPDGFQLYLHSVGPSRRPDIQAVGIQHLMWATDSEADLQRTTEQLRAYDPATLTYSEGGVTFAEGCDPDRGRVIVAYPGPSRLPRRVIARRFQ